MQTFIAASFILTSSCFFNDCDVYGGIGYQPYQPETHSYGRQIGEFRIVSNFGKSFYGTCTHISGINTPEVDWGMNYCGGGFHVEF